MAADPREPTTAPSTRTHICPFCDTAFDHDRRACTTCGGNLVVPIEDRTVYETILPMCGQPHDVEPG